MRHRTLRYSLFLVTTLVIFLLSIPAAAFLYQKADLPLTVYSSDKSILVKKLRTEVTGLKENDRIISIDGIELSTREDIEIIMDTRTVGEDISLLVSSGGSQVLCKTKTVHYYTTAFILLQGFTALVFLLFGLFVFIRTRGTRAAGIFHLATSGVAVMLIMTWGKVSPAFDLSYVTRGIFQAAYALTPIFFFHFGVVFPKDNARKYRLLLISLYSAGLVIFLLNYFSFLQCYSHLDKISAGNYIDAFNAGRYFLMLLVAASITIFLKSYFTARDAVQKKKLKWILMGFIAGPLSFVILWVIPQAITDYGFIPEEYLSVLMLAVPLTFSISILKYHLLDIDLIINRSLVYSLLISGIIIIYFALVLSVSFFIQNVNKTILSTISAVFVAFLFNPLKNSVHKFVDKKFFRVQYDFREAVSSFFSEIKEINDINSLSDKVISGISSLIPVEKMALADMSEYHSPRVLGSINFSNSDFSFLNEKIFRNFDLLNCIADPEKVEIMGDNFKNGAVLSQARLSLIAVSIPVDGKLQLIAVMGNQKSGVRYSPQDIDLLNNILNTTSSVMTRIKLQEELIRKSLEAEHLQELNEQKSFFVSTVSHELKTPLTSIKMYSELLQGGELENDKINSYAGYIAGESERLARLIDNVLNFSRIEKGIKKYFKRPAELNELIRRSAGLMLYQLNLKDFTINIDLADEDMIINADTDSVIEMFINLISNSIKYSPSKKEINISSSRTGEGFSVIFRDCGMGIPEEDIDKLFTPFYRSAASISQKIPGTGLGLSIIKHIAEAHGIKTEISSRLNEGTTFRLTFPEYLKEAYYEEDIIN